MKDAEHHLELHDFLPCQLATLSTSMIRSVASLFEDRWGISISEWKVLATIARFPGLSAVTVAREAGLDTVAVSRAVIHLMDAGYVCREFGKEDRRRSILDLSEAGRVLYEEITPIAIALQNRLLEDLTDEQRSALQLALEALSKRSSNFAAAFEAPRTAPAEDTQTDPCTRTTRRAPVLVPIDASRLSGTNPPARQ